MIAITRKRQVCVVRVRDPGKPNQPEAESPVGSVPVLKPKEPGPMPLERTGLA